MGWAVVAPTEAPASCHAATPATAPVTANALRRRRFAVVLVFANKIDLPHSLSPDEINREMRCRPRPRLRPHLRPCPRPLRHRFKRGRRATPRHALPERASERARPSAERAQCCTSLVC